MTALTAMARSLRSNLFALAACLCVAGGARAQIAGSLDPGFDPNVTRTGTAFLGYSHGVSVITPQPDGKIIIGGSFDTVGGTACSGMARLNADGTVDTTFTSGLAFGSIVTSIALLPDGKLLVSSSNTPSTTYQTTYNFNRLNANGSVDTTFIAPAKSVGAFAVQADGKVVFAGTFGSYVYPYGKVYSTGVMRLKSDGTSDPSFSVSADNITSSYDFAGSRISVTGLAVQSDGKVIIKGDFTTWLGQPRNTIARLNADGSLDASFDPGASLGSSADTASARTFCMALQADGKILLAGSFAGSAGLNESKIVRLNPDGSTDATFNSGLAGLAGLGGFFYFAGGELISLLAVQADGKILVGGRFVNFGGQPRVKIARLTADGSVESTATFDAGSGIGITNQPDNTAPLALALQADGKILIGGDFTLVNGQPRYRMARLLNDPASQTLTVVDAAHVQWQHSGSAPETAQVGFQVSQDGGTTWKMLGTSVRTPGGWQLTGARLPAAGLVRALAFPGSGAVEQTQSFSGLPVFTIATSISPATYNPGYTIVGAPLPAPGSVTGDGNVPAGSAVTLTATPVRGWTFVNWTENGTPVSTAASFTFTPTADRSLAANFVRLSYSITSTASPVNGGATRGGGTWEDGTYVSLVASPAPGFNFVTWTENGVPVATAASLGFAATRALALVANFAPNAYAVSATPSPSGSGTVTGGGTFTHGAAVRLVATPAAGYEFAGWSAIGDVFNGARTLNFTATQNRTLIANFTAIVPISGGGNFAGATNFNSYGGSLTLSAGTGDFSGFNYFLNAGLLTFGGTRPLTTFNVTASALPATGGVIAGTGGVYSGGSVTLLAAPAPGFTFTNWTDNGVMVSTSADYTFTPGTDRALVANFTASSNADLASLASDQCPFAQAFSGNLTTYTARVPAGIKVFTLSPTFAQDGATLKINGIAASPAGSSPVITLQPGKNTITLTVTAPDGTTSKTYTLDVTRFTQRKDLDGDGNADLIFQNAAGQIGAWYFDASGNAVFSASISAAGLGDWKIMDTADMNGDGTPDLIFQNNAGQIAVWHMDGKGNVTSSALLYAGGLGDWRIAAAVDMNGDGHTDLVFQNNIGQIVVWYMDGHGGGIGSATLYGAGLGDWRLRAIADVNGDGIADFIFQNNFGQIAAWHMNAAGSADSAVLLYGGSLGDWKIAAAADMNGDGIPDLVFQNNTGQIAVWHMNGRGAASTSAFIYSGSLGDWRVR